MELGKVCTVGGDAWLQTLFFKVDDDGVITKTTIIWLGVAPLIIYLKVGIKYKKVFFFNIIINIIGNIYWYYFFLFDRKGIR